MPSNMADHRQFRMEPVFMVQFLRSLGNALDIMNARVGQLGHRGMKWAVPQAAALAAKFVGGTHGSICQHAV